MLTVIGDYIEDRDKFYRTRRKSPEGNFPCVVEVGSECRPGGAGAVASMLEGMGSQYKLLGASSKDPCVKTRHFVDDEQVFRVDEDCIGHITNDAVDEIIYRIPEECKIVLVADYGKGVVTSRLWKRLMRGRWFVAVDPSMDRAIEWYRGADAIIPNRKEACVATVKEAARQCFNLQEFFPNVCIKLDQDGMVYSTDMYPGYSVAECEEVVDVCGAGDMVLAAIGHALSKGSSWVDACRFANKMAGLKCQQHGATPVTKNIPEVRRCGRSVATSRRAGW